MDFSTIKQIVIPEGIVKKIEDGDGNVIWQKQPSAQWHTLWSGSAYARIYTTSNNSYWKSAISNTSVLATIPSEAMASGGQLRITWSYSWGTYPLARYYRTNNSSTYVQRVPAQPYILDTTSLGTSTNWVLIGVVANGASASRYQGQAYLKWNSNTQALSLATQYNNQQSIGNNYSAQFTITQIEVYY